ncbi:MAG TPA: Rpn family recombination-promoting nuclease/putative transposase, partial [Opitutales bacterium]|nr:Rpn family recombination-promoting nuclease/putative transposase [Opitutales bacterium]
MMLSLKAYLRDLTAAKSFLDLYLPEDIKSCCDFATIKVESGSFIEKELKQSHTDILYSLKISGQTGFVYVLVEHQSTPDKLMPARMLQYQCSILASHFRTFGRFPKVVPLLFYAGKQSPYPNSCDFT